MYGRTRSPRLAAKEAYQDYETVERKLATTDRNLAHMKESNGRIHFLTQQLEIGAGDVKSLGDEMKSELSELRFHHP